MALVNDLLGNNFEQRTNMYLPLSCICSFVHNLWSS
uniref:Uncharacterized protein n=1 Tax=Arundo donax TaxID=35708 RepID=A0A0A9B8B2_ARUDO